METEEHKIAPKSTLAPIAEQEVADESPEKEPSSSLESSSNLPIVPRRKPKFRGGQPRMVRMRRKRREDPFGSLVQSTKRMRLNEGENEAAEEDGTRKGGDMEGVVVAEDAYGDELMYYYGGHDEDDDSEAEGYDDDSDSNAEDYYKNDYPDEEPRKFFGFVDGVNNGDGYENDSTSDEDQFDHYGDEHGKYRKFCYDEEEDNDGENFVFGAAILAAKNGKKRKEEEDSSEED